MFTARWMMMAFLATTSMVMAIPSSAELQNVTVGGEIRIRGNDWQDTFNLGLAPGLVVRQVRWPANTLQGRPIGDFLGGQNALSYWDWDSKGADYRSTVQRSVVNVRADFSEAVSAFIELDSFNVWGDDFRSNYITGVDARGAARVSVYQSYIETNNMFGQPLRLRIGRQELVFGGGWLIGNNSGLPEFTGLSFDAIRATYGEKPFAVDAFCAKLADRSPIEQDGDTDLYGVYASYTGIEDISLDAYWFLLRDAMALKDTQSPWVAEKIEDIIGIDDFDVTNLHTVGLRGAGRIGAIDFNAEAAYQFGNAGQVGYLFLPGGYSDDDAKFNAWAAHAEVGYNFDYTCRPRIFIGGAYFGGEDNRDITFWQWLNPYDLPKASVSFNRMFSNVTYSPFLDEIAQLSNFWTVWGGVSARPCEKIEVQMRLAYLATVAEFDQPVHFWFGRFRIPLIPALSFWTTPSDAEMGWELALTGKYHYTEDLFVEAGWSHLFTGDGLKDGSFNDFNGLSFTGGTAQDDADYFYAETRVKF